MKRFNILLTILGLLAFWAVVQAWSDTRAEEKKASSIVPVYDSTGAMLEAIHSGDEYVASVTGAQDRIVPVYDATGAMLDALNPNKPVITLPAYDATAAMPAEIQP